LIRRLFTANAKKSALNENEDGHVDFISRARLVVSGRFFTRHSKIH